jgi:hypothetical protein
MGNLAICKKDSYRVVKGGHYEKIIYAVMCYDYVCRTCRLPIR